MKCGQISGHGYAIKARCTLPASEPKGWSDWTAARAAFSQDCTRLVSWDAASNTVLAQHCGEQTEGCVIVGDAEKLIATAGVKDFIIIQDGDCILIADRTKEASIKQLVEQMRRRGLEKYL